MAIKGIGGVPSESERCGESTAPSPVEDGAFFAPKNVEGAGRKAASDVRKTDSEPKQKRNTKPVDYPDRLLDVHEAAVLLGLKATTLYQWAYERRIPVVKLSGRRGPLRFRLSTLLRLIEKAERPALRAGVGGAGGNVRGRG